MLLEHKSSERRKIKIHCERENEENHLNNAIKQTNKMKKTKQRREIRK